MRLGASRSAQRREAVDGTSRGCADLTALEIDLAAITQAGGWKSTRMPLQYSEKIAASRSGMARAAAATGRDTRSEQEAAVKK
jgi:hypothetical protein